MSEKESAYHKGFRVFDPKLKEFLPLLGRGVFTTFNGKPTDSLVVAAVLNTCGISVEALLNQASDLRSNANAVSRLIRKLKEKGLSSLISESNLPSEVKERLSTLIHSSQAHSEPTELKTIQTRRTGAMGRFRADQGAIDKAVERLLTSYISISELSRELCEDYGIRPNTGFLKTAFGSEKALIQKATKYKNFSDDNYRELLVRKKKYRTKRRVELVKVRKAERLSRNPQGTEPLLEKDKELIAQAIVAIGKDFTNGIRRTPIFNDTCDIQITRDADTHEVTCTIQVAESFSKSAALWTHLSEHMQRGAQIRAHNAESRLEGTCFLGLPPKTHINMVLRLDTLESGRSVTLSPHGQYFTSDREK